LSCNIETTKVFHEVFSHALKTTIKTMPKDKEQIQKSLDNLEKIVEQLAIIIEDYNDGSVVTRKELVNKLKKGIRNSSSPENGKEIINTLLLKGKN